MTWKSAVDRLLAILLLPLCLPAIGILVLLVRATSRGPGLYPQVRVGRRGRVFTLYKIRSMRVDAEADGTGAVWAQHRDPRATSVGCWLRDSHLDELPQIFNVLKGEMSLVGPRPERPEFVAVLSARLPHYASRLDALPGITGLAQMNLPPDSDLESVRKKLHLDRQYIEQCSVGLDLRLLLSTTISLAGCSRATAVRWLRVDRLVPAADESRDPLDGSSAPVLSAATASGGDWQPGGSQVSPGSLKTLPRSAPSPTTPSPEPRRPRKPR